MGLPDVILGNRENMIQNQNRIEEMSNKLDNFMTKIKSMEEQNDPSV